jgi:hypothetical protein
MGPSFSGELSSINMGSTATLSWQSLVERVILLGGANRGFLPYNATWKIAASVAQLFQLLPSPLAMGQLALKGLRGSNWVTNLRMAWLRRREKVPFTVQIRATKDSLVGPHDSLDVTRSSNSKELDIAGVGHKDLALLNKDNLKVVEPKLKEKLAEALQANVAGEKPPPQPTPHHIMFLIHGIRDFAEWHEDLTETIKQVATAEGRTAEGESISYGYFSALQFLIPLARRRCARAFLDRYVQCFARNPDAVFSAVAHSNGTFALTWAMRQNPFVRLRYIFLAGSVLYRKFDWQRLYIEGIKVRNECATLDWPVGALCWFLRMVYWRRLGTSGVYGFKGSFVHPHAEGFLRNNLRAGGHSTALNARRHEEIARFLLTGKEMSDSAELSRGEAFWSGIGLWVFRVVIVLIVGVFSYLYFKIVAASLATWITVVFSAGVTVLLLIVLLIV